MYAKKYTSQNVFNVRIRQKRGINAIQWFPNIDMIFYLVDFNSKKKAKHA